MVKTILLLSISCVALFACSEDESGSKNWYEGIYKNQNPIPLNGEIGYGFIEFKKNNYTFQILLNNLIAEGDKGTTAFSVNNLTLNKTIRYIKEGNIWLDLTSPIMTNYNYSRNGDTLIINRPDNPLDIKNGIYIKTNQYE